MEVKISEKSEGSIKIELEGQFDWVQLQSIFYSKAGIKNKRDICSFLEKNFKEIFPLIFKPEPDYNGILEFYNQKQRESLAN